MRYLWIWVTRLTIVAALLVGRGICWAENTDGQKGGSDSSSIKQPTIDFIRDIQPIFQSHCVGCHGPNRQKGGIRWDRRQAVLAGGNPGLEAIVPGHPEASRMIALVRGNVPDLVMPPEGERLGKHQVELLSRWVLEGAHWPQRTDGYGEEQKHWAFVGPVQPLLPLVQESTWPNSEIDLFVLARLQQEGLIPLPEADPCTLIRRVSLDLTGIPPTPEEVEEFVVDKSPDAYEKLVDRLLQSPRYGERWARVWLDLVRYADTQGYEKDAPREIWLYRDWVIKALNRDMPFDQFTIEQMAGDMLPEVTIDQRIATSMHRNTMTNTEGGVDAEEYRVRAVKDRVDTTFQVWMGLTMGCAQCHSHKFDPITQREYYQLFAIFNQTEDNNHPGDQPLLEIPTLMQKQKFDEIQKDLKEVEEEIERQLANVNYREPRRPEALEKEEIIWIDHELSKNFEKQGNWNFVAAGAAKHLGGQGARVQSAKEVVQHSFQQSDGGLEILPGDKFFVDVYLDPDNPPSELMVQFLKEDSWEHRSFWGEDWIDLGSLFSPSRVKVGSLPEPGKWVRLIHYAGEVNLPGGSLIRGLAFMQYGGRAWWGKAGIIRDERYLFSQRLWEEGGRTRSGPGLPAVILKVLDLDEGQRTVAQRTEVRNHFIRYFYAKTWTIFNPLNRQYEALKERERELNRSIPKTPVMHELPQDKQRKTRIMIGGNFLNLGDQVEPGFPSIFHSLPPGESPNRLGLAKWLVEDKNPLTARVVANRYWARMLGIGLVETEEDFGSQGVRPTHPGLLDWLATKLIRSHWSLKKLCKTIVMSATYRQSSRMTPDREIKDPRNLLIARGPRFRLEAEVIRDQALTISGLLSGRMLGPSVKPPQPEGFWQNIYNTDAWETSQGDDRYRRGLYTYWRRTSPYPSMMTFDATSGEVCAIRRVRTNTPLQALVSLNDPVYIEAARALARRIMNEVAYDVEARARYVFRLCLVRSAEPEELQRVVAMYEQGLEHYRGDSIAAESLVGDRLDSGSRLDLYQLAAWTVVSNVLLNLDELLTRG